MTIPVQYSAAAQIKVLTPMRKLTVADILAFADQLRDTPIPLDTEVQVHRSGQGAGHQLFVLHREELTHPHLLREVKDDHHRVGGDDQ